MKNWSNSHVLDEERAYGLGRDADVLYCKAARLLRLSGTLRVVCPAKKKGCLLLPLLRVVFFWQL